MQTAVRVVATVIVTILALAAGRENGRLSYKEYGEYDYPWWTWIVDGLLTGVVLTAIWWR